MTGSRFVSTSVKLGFALLVAVIILFPQPGRLVLAHGSDYLHIDIANDGFQPATISIPPGTTVEWQNKEHKPHSVKGQSGTFNSGIIPESGKYNYTFSNPGSYAYSDEYAPFTGTITVLGTSSTPPPVSPPAPVSNPNPNPNPGPLPTQVLSVTTIGDNFFAPAFLTTTVGATVTWTNTGQKPHTVTSDSGFFDSGMLNPGQTFSFSFQSPGIYSYHCNFHNGQAGSIAVTGSGSPLSNAAPIIPPPIPVPILVLSGNDIQIGDNLYNPIALSVVSGTTVTWTNTGQKPHTVTGDNGLFGSGMLNLGQTFSFSFQSPGIYSYHCIFHNGQTGSIAVTGSDNSPQLNESAPPELSQTAHSSSEHPQDSTPTPTPPGNDIQVADNLYAPPQLSVVTGSTVTWTNAGNLPHTVTSDSGLFDSGMLNPGQAFSFSFQLPGVYSYHCAYHSGQAGTILVGDSASSSSSLLSLQEPHSAHTTVGNVDNGNALPADPPRGIVVNEQPPLTSRTFGLKVFLMSTLLALLVGSLTTFAVMRKLG
ncbi:MAG: cupredoxin domain-containing protein [Chloroflexi bacterium]|nr:cupredoxin domain-containing protein [Chloroflexota bacterium]